MTVAVSATAGGAALNAFPINASLSCASAKLAVRELSAAPATPATTLGELRSNAVLRHHAYRLIDWLVIEAGQHLARHHVPYRFAVRVLAVGKRPHHDVTIGDDADQPIAPADQQAADILVAHLLCRGGNRRQRIDRIDRHAHHLFDLHDCSWFSDASSREAAGSRLIRPRSPEPNPGSTAPPRR
jgi:hypothetical protein